MTTTTDKTELDQRRAQVQAFEEAIKDFVAGYEVDTGEGIYQPNEHERFLIDMAIRDALENDDFAPTVAALLENRPTDTATTTDKIAELERQNEELRRALQYVTAHELLQELEWCIQEGHQGERSHKLLRWIQKELEQAATYRTPAANTGELADDLIAAGALRQLRHNDGTPGFVAAYDKDITDRYIGHIVSQRVRAALKEAAETDRPTATAAGDLPPLPAPAGTMQMNWGTPYQKDVDAYTEAQMRGYVIDDRLRRSADISADGQKGGDK